MTIVVKFVVLIFLIFVALFIVFAIGLAMWFTRQVKAVDNVSEIDAADDYLVSSAREVTPAKYPNKDRWTEPRGA